jgi:hypothetical protein
MGGGFQRIEIAAFRSLFEFVLKKIGHRLSRPHCICGYGVPTLQGLVGGGWGRARGNWSAPEGEGGKFLPVGNNGKRDKTGQDRVIVA